ncbi:MAG: hypothetical protein H6760_00810 [Candidatus Nomurabacteria bacterium]|nr:MAG: hypothetical protein H6760_00810 [Candidatus Nomurabacteria bacterium]
MKLATQKSIFILLIVLIGIIGTYLVLRISLPQNSAKLLELTLDVPASIRVGEEVTLKLHVKNSSDQAITIELGGNPAHAFVISDMNGKQLWDSRAVHDLSLSSKTFSSGEEVIYETRLDKYLWNPLPNSYPDIPIPSTPGVYTIQGFLYQGQNMPILSSSLHTFEIR